MGNPFVHVELNTTNVTKAKDFYKSLFDWKLEDMATSAVGEYTTIKVGDGTGGGIMKQMIPGAGSAWMPYVSVSDIKASTAKAKSLGARVLRDVTEVTGMGWLSIVTDPTGAIIGLWQNKA